MMVSFALTACEEGGGNRADRIFKEEITNPIPEGVEIIAGKRDRLDSSANLIFKVDKEVFEQLVDGYEPVAHNTVLIQAESWMPDEVKRNPKLFCYFKKETLQDQKKESYLFWNEEMQKSYFVSMVY